LNKEVTVRFGKLKMLTTCQPSTVWCSRERLPAAAVQPAKVRQSCSAKDYLLFHDAPKESNKGLYVLMSGNYLLEQNPS
jgi:hypothetical protein